MQTLLKILRTPTGTAPYPPLKILLFLTPRGYLFQTTYDGEIKEKIIQHRPRMIDALNFVDEITRNPAMKSNPVSMEREPAI